MASPIMSYTNVQTEVEKAYWSIDVNALPKAREIAKNSQEIADAAIRSNIIAGNILSKARQVATRHYMSLNAYLEVQMAEIAYNEACVLAHNAQVYAKMGHEAVRMIVEAQNAQALAAINSLDSLDACKLIAESVALMALEE
jgi:hypothetical protein